MALPLAKLTILVGAGLVGSVLAKEGRVSDVSNFLSGAFKVVFKQLRQDDSTATSSKPKYESLMQQVNSLRQELDLFASHRSVTIVTGDRSGSGKYGVVVVVIVVGYGYVWWKGWKISDMMFATRRGLNDACGSVAKQLETVYSSISATKKHLSSRIDRVDCKIDECADNTNATKEEISELRGDVKLVGVDVQSVHHVVRSLESKISRIEGRQNETNIGVVKLVTFVRSLENGKPSQPIEGAAPRPPLELPQISPSRAVSLPSNTSPELPSPSTSNGSRRKQASFVQSSSTHNTVSASGLKEIHGISDGVGMSSLSTPPVSNSCEETETNNNNNPGSGVLGRKFSSISFLSRSRSAMQSFK
ncbi:hypothetical protein ACJIZ3_004611 [Penstemon smallii]|uniref:DUF1664 domain-containing protein n=1 Tax=Penstemon smallii TaxID=265156 RepID=A0ABD3S2K8_9LAMI